MTEKIHVCQTLAYTHTHSYTMICSFAVAVAGECDVIRFVQTHHNDARRAIPPVLQGFCYFSAFCWLLLNPCVTAGSRCIVSFFFSKVNEDGQK